MKNILSVFFAVILIAAAYSLVTADESYAALFKPVDMTDHISGLKDGKIVRGSTISVDVGKVIQEDEDMMESYLEKGKVEVMLRVYSPSDNLYFDYDDTTMTAKLKVSEDKVNADYVVDILITIGEPGDDIFYHAGIDVVEKEANTLSVKGKTAAVKFSKLKKKNQYLKVSKVINFIDKGIGPRTYALSSAKRGKKSYKKYLKINSSTGKVTVKKGLKKGKYTVKIKVRAGGDDYHKMSYYKTATAKITVK